MNLPSTDIIYERLEWLKQKGYQLLLAFLFASTISIIAFFASASTMFFLQPENYKAVVFPQFQSKARDDYKLVAVLENSYLKSQFCSIQSYANTGKSINQEEFCNFNYQLLPSVRSPFDVTLIGLNSLDIRYTTVCLLKLPRNLILPDLLSNSSESQSRYLRNRYVCQKYRAYSRLHIIHKMQTDELIFMELEVQLTQKGYQSLEFLDLRLEFEEERTSTYKFIIDHYLWISGIIVVAASWWSGFSSFLLAVGVIVKKALGQRQEEEEEIVSRIERKKKR